jgi:FlaA1/EpsC-like NDP-sugar epimerase
MSKNLFAGKYVLVTGGTGSIGSIIVKKLLELNPKQVKVLSRDETKQYNLAQELNYNPKVRFLIGDIRDKDRLNKAMDNIDIVFHAAAMKHILACENDPFEAVETNVRGMQNIIDCAMANNVEKVIGVSTDKATDPVSVMGCTKLLAEKIMLAHYKGTHPTKFCFVRFGNVLNSRGSVIPLFYKQIMAGGPVTVTNKEVCRFFMTIDEAVDLIFKAAGLMQDREIFILKNMSVLKIYDLAKAMIELYAPKFGYNPKEIKIEITGLKLGERLHEKLLTEDEALFALENQEMFILVPLVSYELNKGVMLKKYMADLKAKRCKVENYTTEGKKHLSINLIKKILVEDDKKMLETLNHYY